MELSPGLRRDAGRYPGKTSQRLFPPSPPSDGGEGPGMRRLPRPDLGHLVAPKLHAKADGHWTCLPLQPRLCPMALSTLTTRASVLECGGRAKRRHRFGIARGAGNPEGIQSLSPAVARFASPARTELPWVNASSISSTPKELRPSCKKNFEKCKKGEPVSKQGKQGSVKMRPKPCAEVVLHSHQV